MYKTKGISPIKEEIQISHDISFLGNIIILLSPHAELITVQSRVVQDTNDMINLCWYIFLCFTYK